MGGGGGRIVPRNKLYFEIHLTEHCNLDCAGCSHFSPIAQEAYLDPAAFDRDMERLAQITDKKLAYIKLLGGEPLLHPECHQFMYIARKHFDKTAIILLTNGILLTKQTQLFWKSAKDNNVWIAISRYPISLDIDAIRDLSKEYGVPCGYFKPDAGICDFAADIKDNQTMYKFRLDLQGRQNTNRPFLRCNWFNNCFTLRDGKLYTCFMIAHIMHFNAYFDQNLPVTEKDYIDIYKAKDIDEILNFLAKPVPFCRFCNINGLTRGHKWGVSKKYISEWT
jgi:MoaA/NifB/PqqE/SkfB family radical SAM enzyme